MDTTQPTKKPPSLTVRIFTFVMMMNIALVASLTIDAIWYRVVVWWFLGIGPR
jgi:hypothetical protein